MEEKIVPAMKHIANLAIKSTYLMLDPERKNKSFEVKS